VEVHYILLDLGPYTSDSFTQTASNSASKIWIEEYFRQLHTYSKSTSKDLDGRTEP
jgi:hypothetical protein